MNGRIRTALLVLSPLGLIDTLKNLLLWRRVRKDPEALALWNKYFDADQYLSSHPDVARSGVDPVIHFLLRGNREYRDPGPAFKTRFYLGRYPEIAAARVNGLLHFVLFGKKEGRNIGGPAFANFKPQAKRVGSVAAMSINNDWRRDLPLLSVIIPCFNYGKFVAEAIQSVLNQTFKNLEIIVVEGGSTDPATVTEVRRLESLGLPKTRFYYREERHLAGDNRNFGISMARGRYICCLDADDTIRPRYLEVAVFLAETFGYDVVSPSVECSGGSSEKWLVQDPYFPGILNENQIATVAVFRRSAWAHVGGFRDWGVDELHIPEDWDFWIRMLGHGFRGVSIREPLMLYRVHGESLSHGRGTATRKQRESLYKANESLWMAGPATNDPRFVVNPWANLGPEPDAAPGFLLALPYITIGGAEKLFRTLVKGMVARGWRVVVVTTVALDQSMPDDSDSFAKITPHLYRLPRLLAKDVHRFAMLRYLLHRYSIRTMMLAGSEFVYHLLPELKREFPDLSIVDQLFNDTVHVPNNRRYATSIDATVVPSRQLVESFIERGGDTSSTYVIPHGVELPEDSGETASDLPEAARGKIVVGFFGRLSEEKGPDLFVEIAHALSSHANLFFVMTGVGPEREKVLEQIRKYHLEDRIHAPGFVENVIPLMRAADIVVLPSRLDGMPLAVLEAGALGKPVVASWVGSLPSMIEEGKTGFLCEIGDIAAFSKRILELAGDPKLREGMKAAARELVRRKYSAERMVESYEEVFQTAVRGPENARMARGAR